MKRILVFYILTNLFSVGFGGIFGYALFPLLRRSRPNVSLSEPLTDEDRLRRSQELARERGEEEKP